MRTPTDNEKYMMVEEYQSSLHHLKKLGLIQIIDGGVCIRATPKGLVFMKATTEIRRLLQEKPEIKE